MAVSVTYTRHGAAAFDALADAVLRAKGDDPLAPVAVIVPTNTAGVMARRALGRRGGAAAIDVLTVFRLAELLGAPSLHAEGRNPVSTPVVDLAVKRAIHDSPGVFAGVNHHPSTVVALRELYRELRAAGPGALRALAAAPRGAEPARVTDDVTALLAAEWYDEGDLLVRATARASDDLPTRLRRVIVYLPQRLRPLEGQLLAALAERGTLEIIVGITGDPDADAGVVALASAFAGDPLPTPVVPDRPDGDVTVVSTTDADDEVRIGVRTVVDAARAGTRFDRIAVLFPADQPYARLVEHQLSAAGIPWNGRPGTVVGERMVPRVLAELLELDRRGLRRSALMTLLGDVPARRADGRFVPTARWERIGRAAGVVREEDWHHLVRYADEVRTRDVPEPDAEAEAALELLAFVGDLRKALGDPAVPRPWATWVAWAKERLEWWFGPGGLDRLEGAEREGWEQTTKVLDRLDHLDSVGAPATRAEFRATFVAELDITPGRRGKVGDGVHVSTIAGAAGLDVDAAVLLGAAEGLVPPRPTVDPLLGDTERELAGLEGASERAALVHRQFLAVAATTPAVTITVPRGDLRATATHHESRWIAPLLAASDRLPVVIDSHAHGLAATRFPVSASEHRLRQLWSSTRAGADIRELPLAHDDVGLRRALRLNDARASSEFTEFDGNLTGRPVAPLPGTVSPTRLEVWAGCPHAYFVQYVLGVRPIDEPADIETLSPIDRGTAIHDAIDRLHHLVLDGTLTEPGPDGWADEHAVALRQAGDAVADALHAAGRTGRTAFWVNARAEMLDTLDAWLAFDRGDWRGRKILSSEDGFGDDERVELVLPDGRRIGFRGKVDRIDELPDGTLVVTDHKTGKPDKLGSVSADDPTLAGRRYQLPVYAAAARALVGRPDAPVRAGYTYFRPKFQRVELALDDDIERRVGAELARVVGGIESGVYPAIPQPPKWALYVDCWYCDPDGLGTAPAWANWERKRSDPVLAKWFPPDEEAASDG